MKGTTAPLQDKGYPARGGRNHVSEGNHSRGDARQTRAYLPCVDQRGVQLLREAKKRGVAVTAETCPHYFTLTDEVVTSFDANTKVNPPIREAEDVAAIREGLRDGTLDCIVTDHAPHHRDEKNVEYNLAAFGISGIETSFLYLIPILLKGCPHA